MSLNLLIHFSYVRCLHRQLHISFRIWWLLWLLLWEEVICAYIWSTVSFFFLLFLFYFYLEQHSFLSFRRRKYSNSLKIFYYKLDSVWAQFSNGENPEKEGLFSLPLLFVTLEIIKAAVFNAEYNLYIVGIVPIKQVSQQ